MTPFLRSRQAGVLDGVVEFTAEAAGAGGERAGVEGDASGIVCVLNETLLGYAQCLSQGLAVLSLASSRYLRDCHINQGWESKITEHKAHILPAMARHCFQRSQLFISTTQELEQVLAC